MASYGSTNNVITYLNLNNNNNGIGNGAIGNTKDVRTPKGI